MLKDNEHAGHEQEEEEHAEDESESEFDEDECDEAIAGLLEQIEQQRMELQSLRDEIAALREQHAGHERDYEHTRKPEQTASDIEPDERHFYFRRIGRS